MKPNSNSNNSNKMIKYIVAGLVIIIVAGIAIPNYIAYRKRGYNSHANADLKSAFTSAQAYFTDNPVTSISSTELVDSGFKTISPTESTDTDDGLTQTDLNPEAEE